MKVIIEQLLLDALNKLKSAGRLSLHLFPKIKVEPSKQAKNGNFYTNLPLTLAKSTSLTPINLAIEILSNLAQHPFVVSVELAAPGFINFFISNKYYFQILRTVLFEKEHYGQNLGCDFAKTQDKFTQTNLIEAAYARICSLFRQLVEQGVHFNDDNDLSWCNNLDLEPGDLEIMNLINLYPEIVRQNKSQKLDYYFRELANSLHSYYNAFTLLCEDRALANIRLCLLKGVRQVLENSLQLVGVSTPESV